MKQPLVSIVIPIFNGERHLEQCITSVLGQTYSNIELVLADSASTDRSQDVIDRFSDSRLRQLPLPDRRLQVHENWERALGAATGEFVKLVCQDDALMPDCVANQLDLMTLYPDARIAASRRTIIGEDGRVLLRARGLGSLVRTRSPRLVTVHELARACARAGTNLLGEPASVLFRREFLSCPLFDRSWHYTMDLDLYFRALNSGSAVVDQRVVAYFRISAYQLSAKLAGQQARETRDFFAHLARTYPGTLSRLDLAVASVTSFGTSLGRKYLYLRQRERDG